MPTVIVPSGSDRTHSWLSVYLSSAGTFIVSFSVEGSGVASVLDQHFAVANERRLDDARGELLVADSHGDGLARRDACGNARQRNGSPECWRERAAGDLALAFRGRDALVAAEHAAFVDKHETHLRSPRWSDKRRLAYEVARAHKIDGPRKPGLERRLALGHVLAIEIHAGFEPQRVARAE